MKTISIAIQKGGSGKTTTAVNLAAALRDRGKKVLLLDIDPQSNLTQSMGVNEEPKQSLYHVLKAEASGEDGDLTMVMVEANGMDLVPASLDLAGSELELASVYGREKLLTQLLYRVKGKYDFAIIDCPPSFGMLTVNALVASDYVLMPLQAEFLPLTGVRSFLRHFKQIQKLNKKVNILGFVLTKFDTRKKMNQKILMQLKDEFGIEKVFTTFIRSNIALATAQEKGLDIFSFKKNTNGAEDYKNLATEFLNKVD
jgi:chromosome partitioning protein